MDAMSLRELQEGFWQAIAATPGELRASPALLRVITPDARLAAKERLAIYADMYWHRISDVLAEDFARTADVVGADAFTALARAYLAARPSREPSIARVGEAFADFLATHPPEHAPPYAAALARLEWARIAAFDAPDAEPLTLPQLADLPPAEWPELALGAAPSLTVHDLGWPVQRALDPAFTGTIDDTPTTVRVWRSGFTVYHASVDATELPALRRLVAGATFGEIGEACGEPDVAASLLARWLEDGIVVRAPGIP
jgi:hypothetical protein